MLLRDLRDKYERMRILRAQHARARADGTWEEPDPRPEMIRLAAEFPGALREVDQLPGDVIEARILALDAALGGAPVAPWMTAQLVFHANARAILSAKRWLAGARTIDAPRRAAFVAARPDLAWLADDLAAIAAPPSGRLMDVVHARVADRLGIAVAEARRLVLAF